MTLDQLRIFIAVAELQHITKAAAKLNKTQSAVSASITALEKRHQVRLFQRVGRRIEISEGGRELLREAKTFLAEAETLEIMLDDLGQETRGCLRVFASQTIASYWLPKHLVTLRKKFPAVTIRLTVSNTAQAALAVEEGAADIGFVEGDVDQKNLARQIVARDQLVMFMSASHPWCNRLEIPHWLYHKYPWVMREAGSGTRSEFASYLQTHGMSLEDLDIFLELPSNEAVLSAVANSQGISVLSRRAAESGGLGRQIRIVPKTIIERPFTLLVHPERHRTRAAQSLLNQIGVDMDHSEFPQDWLR